MQQGSLVQVIKECYPRLLSDFVRLNSGRIIEEDTIYEVCDIFPDPRSASGMAVKFVEVSRRWSFNPDLFVEVQPPLDLTELIEESILEPA